MSVTTAAAYRPDIDGLRAIAVVAVILNHAEHKWLAGGYLGVDVFFVISGFVITTSLQQRPAERLGQLVADFFARRARRLVPALALCVAASGIAAWLIDPNPAASLSTGLAALVGLSNVFLLRTAQDYFAPGTALNLFTQTWSLGVEEQFYLLFPLLVWATGLSRRVQGATRLFRACFMLSLLSLVALFLLPGKDGGAAYFLVFGRLWELGCGVMAALAKPKPMHPVVAWIGLGGVILALAVPLPPTALTGLAVVPPTVLLIVARETRLLALAPVVALGRMSYSLYLWHWPVISAGLFLFGQFPSRAIAELIPILVLGTESYLLVERPARGRLSGMPRRWSFLSAFIAATMAATVLIGLDRWQNPVPIAARPFIEIPAWFPPLPGTQVDHLLECTVEPPLRPARPTTFDRCTVPPRSGVANTVWAMGDSHAGQLQGLLVSLHGDTGLGIHLIETPGVTFPFPPGVHLAERESFFATMLSKARLGDIVLLGRLFISRGETFQPVSDIDAWLSETEALATRLQPLGLHVVVVGPPPMFRFASIFSCAPYRDGTTSCDLDRATLAAAIDPIATALRQAAARHPNLHIFDAFAALCPPEDRVCSPVRNGVPLFRDSDHLNAVGAAGLAPAFERFLTREELSRT